MMNGLQLFRIFVPSWKFFDGASLAPELYHRFSLDGESFSDWQVSIPKVQKRSFKNLWINDQENYYFAAHALLEYFMSELSGDLPDENENSVTLKLIQNLVVFQIRAKAIQPLLFQFQIEYPDDLQEEPDTALYCSKKIEYMSR
jgi:hypothetical protein